MKSKIVPIIVGVVILIQAARGYNGGGNEYVTHLSLGETEIGFVEWKPANQMPTSPSLPLRFLNLHQNENCSVAAAKALVHMKGSGSVFYFNKTLTQNGLATRGLYFTVNGRPYNI